METRKQELARKERAFKDMDDFARDVVSPEIAASIIAPWATLKEIGVKPRRLKHFRIMYRPENAEDWAYSASDVVVALAEFLGMEKYYSRYEGDGSRHQDEMEHAVAFLKEKETAAKQIS